jgi:DDE superfamily endonuclease
MFYAARLLRRMQLNSDCRASQVPSKRVPGQAKFASDLLRSPASRREFPHLPDRLRLDHRHLHPRGCHGRHLPALSVSFVRAKGINRCVRLARRSAILSLYRGIRELIDGAGARVLYLPPYHPELNPIELAWSKLEA